MNVNYTDVIATSSELSRTINDLGVLTVIAGIFLVLVVILFSFFIYQLIIQQKKLDMITQSIDRLLDYMRSSQVNDVINNEQLSSIIGRTFERLADKSTIMSYKLAFDKQTNAPHEVLIARVDGFVDNLFRTHKIYLSQFKYCNHYVSEYIDNSWREKLQITIMKNLNDEISNIYLLESSYANLFTEFKELMVEKLMKARNEETK